MNTVLVSRSASMHADKIVLLNIVPSTSAIRSSLIGPLQLVIHVVQNRHGGEQQTHRDKKNKELTSWFTINKSVPLFVCSQCFSCSPAWRALTTWIRGGSRASDKKISGGFGGGGGATVSKQIFSALRASVWSKNKGGPLPLIRHCEWLPAMGLFLLLSCWKFQFKTAKYVCRWSNEQKKFTFIHEQCSLKHKRNDSIWYELAVLVPVRSILLPAPDIVAERAVDQKDEHEEEVEIR